MRPQDTISVEVHSAQAAIVTLRGEHDLASAPDVQAALATASRVREVIVDLSPCTFIDSSVISALLRASGEADARGGHLSLVVPPNGQGVVGTVVELMSLDRVMPTYETLEVAVQHLDAATSAASPAATRLRALSEIIDLSLIQVDDQRRAA